VSAAEELNLARFIAEFRRIALLPPAFIDGRLMPHIQFIRVDIFTRGLTFILFPANPGTSTGTNRWSLFLCAVAERE